MCNQALEYFCGYYEFPWQNSKKIGFGFLIGYTNRKYYFILLNFDNVNNLDIDTDKNNNDDNNDNKNNNDNDNYNNNDNDNYNNEMCIV